MQRALAKLLIFAFLFAGIAWAADGPEAEVVCDTYYSSLNSDLPSKFSTEAPCDHCCHGAAHYLGLLSDLSSVLVENKDHTAAWNLNGYPSYAVAPPVRPPKA